MEYLGYEIEPQEDNSVLTKHKLFGKNFMKVYLGGVLLRSSYKLNDNAKQKRLDLLEAVNEINSKSHLVTYYVTANNDALILRMDGFYLGAYEKKISDFSWNHSILIREIG